MVDDRVDDPALDFPGSRAADDPSGQPEAPHPEAQDASPDDDDPERTGDGDLPDDVSSYDFKGGEIPPGGTPDISFHQKEQRAGVIYNVGVMTGFTETTDKPVFEEVPSSLTEQVKQLFVPPRGYPTPLPPSRTIVVAGPAHSGRFFCSVYIAEALRLQWALAEPEGKVLLYNRLRREATPLLQALSFLEKGSILILEDALEKNVSERELTSNELLRLNAILEKRRSFLILTTTAELKTGVPIISTKLLDLPAIFEKHLLSYFASDEAGHEEVGELARRHKKKLAPLFASPFQVEHFFQKLRSRSPRSENEIQRLATEAIQAGRQDLRGWFDALPSHVKLIGLLACLMEGIGKSVVEALYVESVRRLRAGGFEWIADLRALGLLEAWHLLRVDSDTPQVQFTQKSIREELEWQVENRHILLWAVMQPIASDVAGKTLWREDVRARAILGAAVGWLGTWDDACFRSVLEGWAHARDYLAKSPENGLGSLPGYALVENLLSDRGRGRPRVMKILSNWITSHDPALMWAAGAALWRLYHAASGMATLEISGKEQARLGLHLIERLEELVSNVNTLGKINKQNEARVQLMNCAASALKRIGEVDAPQFLSTLTSWFGEGSKNFSWTASRAAQFMFLDLAERRVEPDSLDTEARLRLIEVILSRKSPESDAVVFMFDWLEQWLRWPTWGSEIRNHLLGIANWGPRSLRSALRAALSRYWMGSARSATGVSSETARALIARSYAMDGVLTQSPSLGRGLLIVDSDLVYGQGSRKAEDPEGHRQAERREGTLRQIIAMVEAVMAEKEMDVTVLLLGAQEATVRENGALRLTTDLPLHRLMKPGIQNIAPEHLRMVLLLTAGPVIDLEDALDSLSADHKLVIAAGCDLEVSLGTELLRIKRDLSSRDLDAIEKKLRLLCARAQASLDPAAWGSLLERLGVDLTELDANPEATLAAWAAQLGEIPFPDGHDPAKKILCALLRLAAADLDACLQIVRAWLTEEQDLERPMAAAVAVALVRTVTDAPSIWGGLAPQSIFDGLAGPLAASGKDGTDFMLETVERWLADPVLAEILAGAIEDGRCRLLRWAEEAAPQQLAAFEKALEPLRESLEETELGPSGEILDAVFDRLRVRLAMGRPRPLPPLATGETYAVIVFDAAARWGPLAAKLFKRFNQPEETRKPLLYRLGERWPSWVAGDPNPDSSDLSPVGVRLPRLLGPILRELSPASVSFLVVLAGEMWIDAEDWLSSPWRARIITHRQLADGHLGAEWVALPRLPGQEKDEVDLMATYLKQQPVEDLGAGR